MSVEMSSVACDLLRELRVLIVEDNAGDRFLYKQMLVEADPGTQFVFDEAGTGAEALHLFTAKTPDCILLDYLLPDMLGVELLAALNQQDVPLPAVLMLTGFGDEKTAVSALQGGAHGYIPKRELTGAALSRAVNGGLQACKNRHLQQQSRQQMAQRNDELEQKYQQIGIFYRKIVGRLQQPARSIRDRLAAIMAAEAEGPIAGAQFRAAIRELQTDSERLTMALANMMDNPDVNLGQLLIARHPVSIMEMISNTVNVFRPLAEAAAVRLSVRIQPGLPEVEIDRYQIERVLANLLDNAIRHTPGRGQVFLKVERFPAAPGEVSIAVIDTGKGIHPDRLATLFERQQADGGAADQKLPGIGLHVCREIVHAHKGRIAAQSLLEAGTCITFTLPLETGPATARAVWEQAAQCGVDDRGWPRVPMPPRIEPGIAGRVQAPSLLGLQS